MSKTGDNRENDIVYRVVREDFIDGWQPRKDIQEVKERGLLILGKRELHIATILIISIISETCHFHY